MQNDSKFKSPFLIETAEKIKVIDNKTYLFEELDKLPEFAGGIQNFKKQILRNFEMPNVEDEIKGKLIVEFSISKDGFIYNLIIIKDAGFGSVENLVKAIKKTTRWKPGEKNGNKVNSKYQIEIDVKN